MLDMSMKRDLRAFPKFRQCRKKCSLSSTSKLQLHKGFKVSRKRCLNLCSFKWLKLRCNLVEYLTPSESVTLNIDHLLGLIKEKFAIENYNRLQVLYFWRKLQLFRQRNWKERIFETISSVIVKSSLFFARIRKAFTRWYDIEKLRRAFELRVVHRQHKVFSTSFCY